MVTVTIWKFGAAKPNMSLPGAIKFDWGKIDGVEISLVAKSPGLNSNALAYPVLRACIVDLGGVSICISNFFVSGP